MATWTVEHREHEFVPVVVGEPEIEEPDEPLIATVYPENLHFTLRLGVLGPEDIDYEISVGAEDSEGDPIIEPDMVGPYRTDFLLKRTEDGSEAEELDILGGLHTSFGGVDGEQPNDHVKVAGKGWLHYLERRHWPYDADLSYVNWPEGFRFKVAAAEIGLIVKNVLETVRDVSPNFPDPPDASNPSYSLAFTVNADDTGETRNFEIAPFETQSIYSLIQQLAQADKDDGGFDFCMTPAKVFRLITGEIGDPETPIFTLEVDVASAIANMIEAGFTNTGPEATHVLGVGAGTSTRAGGVNRHFRANSARYRRLDKVADFGDVKNLATLQALAAGELSFGANPVHEIPITVDPEDIPGFWTSCRPGEYIEVVYDFGWHTVTSVQRIVEMDCRVSLEGEESVALSLNQWYDVDTSTGLADW